MVKTRRMPLLPCLLLLLLSACGSTEPEWTGSASGAGVLGDAPPFLNPFRAAGSGTSIGGDRAPPRGHVDIGREVVPRRSGSVGGGVEAGDIELNFVNAEVQEFVRVAFDEILREPVVVDPSIQGRVTVRTPGAVSKRAALDIVRAALETQGLQMGKTGATYRISGRGGASGGAGGHVRVLHLSAISAEQAKAALQPFTNGQVQISGGTDGRSLLLSGAASDVEGLAQLVGALDVDQMRAVSFALLPLREASATAVSNELNQMFGAREGQGFKAMPIQRVNGVLITTRSKETLERARSWVRKLDQTGKDTRRVNVYQLQNRRANEVAHILQGMFGVSSGQSGRTANQRAPIAPGFTPALSSGAAGPGASSSAGVPRLASIGSSASLVPNSEQGGLSSTGGYAEPPVSPAEASVPLGASSSEAEQVPVSIRADTATNSIVVVSKPDDYRMVESAIRRLDVLPSQVLIEATIVEVGLNDALRHGVRWFLQNGNHGGSLTDSASGSFGNVYPGFNYTFNAGGARLVVNALEKITDVEIVSSPALTVLDNQPATLKIGDQVPVATRSARSVINPDAPTVNEIEMKDTGIILQVVPRVNSSGLVMLDISQEASDVVPTTSSAIDSPTIRQRKINSSVAVQSGSEIVLGGIISRRKTKSKEGIPGLMHIPVLGSAFTSLGKNERERTELMVIIRPTVVNSRQDLQILTQEIKSRMAGANMALYR